MAEGRTAKEQGMAQLAALGCTLFISIVGGLLTGFLVSNCCLTDNYFDDEEHFHEVEFDVPLEEMEAPKGKGDDEGERIKSTVN